MTKLPTVDLKVGATAPASSAREPRVLELAESREHFAAPETTEEIAAWVNEGGAGGEVKR